MAPTHSSSILSTHSGHHRIFIGPVVQKHSAQATANNTASNISPNPHQSQRKQDNHQNHHNQAPKPWWDHGSSYLRSHLSLHNLTQSDDQPVNGASSSSQPTSTATGESPLKQTSIPQLSYTFSDDSSSEETLDTEDEEIDGYDSDEERRDYSRGRHVVTDANGYHGHDHDATSSSESLSAPVGHCVDAPSSSLGQNGWGLKGKGKEKALDKGKGKAVDTEGYSSSGSSSVDVDNRQKTTDPGIPLTRLGTKKKRTKSMRDEGEPSGFKKLFAHYREGKNNQGLMDNPDLEWESDDGSRESRPRVTRQVTSGALTASHQHVYEGNHPTLTSSPLSSNLDLPGAHHGPVFVSSPVSSVLDVSNTSKLGRPEPTPIQRITSDSGGESDSDRLGPTWKPSSSSNSVTTASSPKFSRPKRVTTWMTARESSSTVGRESLHVQTIEEGDEDENDLCDLEEQDENAENADEHYSLAKVISNESCNGAGVQDYGEVQGANRKSQGSTGKAVESQAADTVAKDPPSTSLGKSSTRFGRALLNRAPTGMKRQDDMPAKDRPQQRESMCSVDKDCQGSIENPSKPKKHVRFLTKVQYQIASSRQPTLLSTHPIVKQDRMLVRKEMTERPGPHVFNSDTARRLERQSQGWREWWCVMKGPPVGEQRPITKITKKSKSKNRAEKGRLEFYYNHKKISGTVVFSSETSVSVYSSLDYSIAVTQNYRDAIGLTVYILRPRTIALACAWYMEIYTLLHGAAPIPSFIEIAVPDFDVKVRVPMPEDSESETDDDSSNSDTALSPVLPKHSQSMAAESSTSTSKEVFQTAATSFPARMATKTFYLTNDKAKPTLVAPDEVTPRLLRSHVLHLLKDVSDWSEVVKTWLDPTQHGDVALCWKRYDRIEWIYWGDRVLPETDNLHLRKDHIGFADGSEWSGKMDETVVGPQVLDKTHLLELRPITHYPTKAKQPGPQGVELHEPDPIEGYLVRVSTFSGNPIRRFRRLYLTSHDHLLIYTIPSQSNSPTMQHAGSIDPSALMFCITPHRSANPDHKDMAQSRSVRRLKAQVRAARGFIDMTKIESVRVLTVQEWESVRNASYKKKDKESSREKLGKAAQRVAEAAEATRRQQSSSGGGYGDKQETEPPVVMKEPDSYFFPVVPDQHEQPPVQGTSSQQEQEVTIDNAQGLDASEPMNNSLGKKSTVNKSSGMGSLRQGIVKSATFVADMLLHNDSGNSEDGVEDSNVIEIEMKGGPCVRFRAYSAEAAHLWRNQLEKLAEYWTLRKHLDVKEHVHVSQANYQLASSLDDDEVQVGTGQAIQDWDSDRAMVSPEIWNWCVANGCRSITKSGMVYFKPTQYSTFQKMFLVLTEGYLMLFYPHRRSKTSGRLIPTTASKLHAIHSLTDVYLYSGHFANEDTYHGTNDESERLPRFYPDGLIADDPDDDCTFSIWRGQRRTMFSRRGSAMMSMSSREVSGSSKIFGKDGLLSSMVKEGVVYGSTAQSCSVFRARSRSNLEEWVYAINMEIERCVRAERRRVRTTGHL